jgi:isoleucyl-tRNA synthetase
MAPFTPFITEQVWQHLFVVTTDSDTASVHLANWPAVDTRLINESLTNQMDIVRNVVELGRTARAESKVKNRQPLARALISSAAWQVLSNELREQIASELNVKQLAEVSSEGDLVTWSAKGNFKQLGARFGARTQEIAQAIAAVNAARMVQDFAESGASKLQVNNEVIELTRDDVILTETPSVGWSVAASDGITVALDLNLTPELVAEGLSREVIRLIQDTRKSSGFEVTDRIVVTYQAQPEVDAAIEQNLTTISNEVLAKDFNKGEESRPATAVDEELGLTLWLTKA